MKVEEKKDKLIGYSTKISDSKFNDYVKKTNRFAIIFTIVIALVAIIGFYIAGLKSDNMSMLESLIIGIGIASMFIIIGLHSVLSRRKNNIWDGVVVDKKIKKKTEDIGTADTPHYSEYLLYIVKIKGYNGKRKTLKWRNNKTGYDYYEIGDKVRYHGLLKTFEKYDKTKDKIIFCNACLKICNINDEHCSNCKCPILK